MGLFDFAGELIGGLLGYESNARAMEMEQENVRATNEANAKMLERQIEANKETMTSRHQWEVDDLRKAGLNPMLSTTSPTGTLSAPNASPAAKSNSAQFMANNANVIQNMINGMLERNKLEVDKINAKANMYNADTNRINAINSAEGAKAVLDEERSKNRADYEIASVQLKQRWKELGIQEALAKANISKIEQDTIYQKTVNEWAPKMMKAEHDQKLGQIANEAMIARATVYNLHVTADAASSSAASQAVIAESTRRLNEKIGKLTDAQAERELQGIVLDLANHNVELPSKLLKALEDGNLYKFYKENPTAFWFSTIWHNVLPLSNSSSSGGSIRLGKNFGLRD